MLPGAPNAAASGPGCAIAAGGAGGVVDNTDDDADDTREGQLDCVKVLAGRGAPLDAKTEVR